MRLIGLYSKTIYLETSKEAELHRLMNHHFKRKVWRAADKDYDEYLTLPEPMVIKRQGGQEQGAIVRVDSLKR